MRVTINLNKEESAALYTLADMEYRDPHGQILFIVRTELTRLGLIPPREMRPTDQETTPPGATITEV